MQLILFSFFLCVLYVIKKQKRKRGTHFGQFKSDCKLNWITAPHHSNFSKMFCLLSLFNVRNGDLFSIQFSFQLKKKLKLITIIKISLCILHYISILYYWMTEWETSECYFILIRLSSSSHLKKKQISNLMLKRFSVVLFLMQLNCLV